ncbi:MAG: threonine--tRNA ligase [Anaerolineaceae bacterium 4572_78]|nr:MAG: threonine--tRNA ligase [Anaerolineaceae bacterium 4572_78]
MTIKSSDLEQDKLYKMQHSTAHVMAQAVLHFFPEAKLGIGPPIENGFYYDFDLGLDDDDKSRTFTPEDLKKIEKEMKRIINGKHEFTYRELTPDEARQLYKDQPYKLELIEGLVQGGTDEYGNEADEATTLSTYCHDTFEDLCRGPHVEATNKIRSDSFKLMSVAGAYWRGDENNPMLQRIYGTVWHNKKELKAYLKRLEEAKKRDHRKLGKELDIYTFDDEVGSGLPLWLPNGGIMIEEIEKLAKEMERKRGYLPVRTPHLTKEDLFLRSGHLPYYADSMYPPMEMEGVTYYIKPMNCPFHHKIFSSRPRSYRDLPMRLAEYGTCYRFEKSGELMGLMRVRSMQMNDAHIYCAESDFETEFMDVVDLYQEYFRLFGIDKYVMRLSTHHKNGLGKKYIDNERLWLKTEVMVRDAMTNGNVPFVEVTDEAAFYGPKIDVQIWTALGREFSLATNQVDFAQPSQFDLTFTNSKGEAETPLCIHRAPLSTHERLIGFLLEHYAGKFPIWLSPEQVRIIPITTIHNEHAVQLENRLKDLAVRAKADMGSERMNAKIRQAQLMKVPYMVVVGDKEIAENTIALRKRDGTRQNNMPVDEFVASLVEKIATRSDKL